jgi:hypothetical protein
MNASGESKRDSNCIGRSDEEEQERNHNISMEEEFHLARQSNSCM